MCLSVVLSALQSPIDPTLLNANYTLLSPFFKQSGIVINVFYFANTHTAHLRDKGKKIMKSIWWRPNNSGLKHRFGNWVPKQRYAMPKLTE